MALRFTEPALRDLSDIAAWVAPLSPAGYANVVASVRRTLKFIERNPQYGRPGGRENLRVALETTYKHLKIGRAHV